MTFSEARVQYGTVQYNTVRQSTLSLSAGTEQGLRQKDIDKGQFYCNDIMMEAKLDKGRATSRATSRAKVQSSTQQRRASLLAASV